MNFSELPSSFEESVELVKEFALAKIVEAARQQQLYYHSRNHVEAVQRRADRIFQAIAPYVAPVADQYGVVSVTRTKHLIDLCAIAHDMVQEFLPQNESSTRRRESGISEAKTISELVFYINSLNICILENDTSSEAIFIESDIKLITEAIEATICLYDTDDNSIYQPLLYSTEKKPSLISYALALADVGALGMEGIQAFHEEGSLIFLEENPDIIPVIQSFNQQSTSTNHDLQDLDKQDRFEDIKQRLLRRARFQVNFAKGRKNRFHREVKGLPLAVIDVLENEVFEYLTEETIHTIEAITPTSDSTNLQQLLDFFELDKYLNIS